MVVGRAKPGERESAKEHQVGPQTAGRLEVNGSVRPARPDGPQAECADQYEPDVGEDIERIGNAPDDARVGEPVIGRILGNGRSQDRGQDSGTQQHPEKTEACATAQLPYTLQGYSTTDRPVFLGAVEGRARSYGAISGNRDGWTGDPPFAGRGRGRRTSGVRGLADDLAGLVRDRKSVV